MSQQRIADVKNRIKDQYDSKYTAIAYMPFLTHVENESDGYLHTVAIQLDAMTAAQELNVPCVNSYTGFDPGNYLNFFFDPRDKTLDEWCEFNQYKSSQIQHINDLGFIKASTNFLWSAEIGKEGIVVASKSEAGEGETFRIVELNNTTIAFKAANGLYLSVDSISLNVFARSSVLGPTELFKVIEF